MKEIPKSPERLAILEKIAQYEREGRFDEDVENDPPSRVLLPEEIEYADRRFPAECRRTGGLWRGVSVFLESAAKKRAYSVQNRGAGASGRGKGCGDHL